jgi:hypothetical protein
MEHRNHERHFEETAGHNQPAYQPQTPVHGLIGANPRHMEPVRRRTLATALAQLLKERNSSPQSPLERWIAMSPITSFSSSLTRNSAFSRGFLGPLPSPSATPFATCTGALFPRVAGISSSSCLSRPSTMPLPRGEHPTRLAWPRHSSHVAIPPQGTAWHQPFPRHNTLALARIHHNTCRSSLRYPSMSPP